VFVQVSSRRRAGEISGHTVGADVGRKHGAGISPISIHDSARWNKAITIMITSILPPPVASRGALALQPDVRRKLTVILS
jgi:hypothetical protein